MRHVRLSPRSWFRAAPARTGAPVLAALAGALAASPAAAAPPGDSIVLEARTGARPADADRLLGPVLAELGRSGFAGPAAVGARIDQVISRPSRALREEEAAEALRAVEAGYKQFLAGRFDPAVQEIERGLAVLRASPDALVGKNERRRDAVMRGLVGLALAHKRRGRAAKATEAMRELVRSFPDREVSYKEYGPEPRDFFEAVRADLGADGKGSIAVDLDDDRTVVFVNERYAGTGDVVVGDLYPGVYRLFLQQGNQPGRVHEVAVEAGGAASVALSWPLDASLRTGGAASLVFDDDAARRDLEPRFAVRVARALGAPGVVVVGIRENAGRRSVVGAFYTSDSTRPLRSGAVAVEPIAPSADRFQALARLLAGDEAAAALVTPLSDDGAAAPGSPARPDEPERGARPLRTWKWIALAGGAAALGTGVTLIAIHDSGGRDVDGREAFERNTRPAGIAIASAGAVLTGLGIYLFVRDRRDAREAARGAALVPIEGGGALVVSGRF
jgi:hypothetical protein